jgi:ABC-type dipeptide/oligopeptide/nickel transport system permease subunit
MATSRNHPITLWNTHLYTLVVAPVAALTGLRYAAGRVVSVALALVIASLLGGGIHNVIIALCVGSIGGKARMMCGLAQTVRENDYVIAERVMGANDGRIMLRHIFPNCFPPLLVMVTMSMGMVILGEASLSFLGIGVLPPTVPGEVW